MSDDGVYAISRSVWDHPLFANEPYTEREAWIWMIGAAAWKPTRVRVGRSVVNLVRGQLSFSERFLATKWRWSKSKTHRFLIRLKNEAMADLAADRETNLISICNYDDYQFGRTSGGPVIEPQTEPVADQPRTKEEELNNLIKEPEAIASAADAAPEAAAGPTRAELEREFFRRGKQVLGSNAGGMLTNLLKTRQYDIALARGVVEVASTKQDAREYVAGAIRAGPRQPSTGFTPRPGSKDDTRERTVHALRKLRDYVDTQPDESGSGRQGCRPDVGLLPFA